MTEVLAQEVITALFSALKTLSSFGREHSSAKGAVERLLPTLEAQRLPLKLQFVGGSAFINRTLVSVRYADYAKVEWLARIARASGADELEFTSSLSVSGLSAFVEALSRTPASPENLEEIVSSEVRWRELDDAKLGQDGEQVDTEMYALSQLALALLAAEEVETTLAGEACGWPWSAALTVVRRLESALSADAPAVLRGIELAPDVSWGAGRCATSAVRCVLQVLGALQLPQTLTRAAAHATLGTVICGLRDGAKCAPDAAEGFSRRARRTSARELSRSAHRVRTLAAAATTSGSPHPDLEAMRGLLETVWGLEAARVHANTPPRRIELLAMGLRTLDEDWMRLVIQTEGAVPCGSRVRLRDGRAGLVIGPARGASPWKPLVLVGREVLYPDQDVSIS